MLTDFISNLIGNDLIATVVMSIVPLIELKGGIIFAESALINPFLGFALAYAGATIVFIPIYWLLRPILNALKKIRFIKGFADKIENYFQNKADETMEKSAKKHANSSKKKGLSEKLLKQLGVFIFVAIPLPMTGVWTGTAIAVFLNLKFKDVILPILAGNLVAGLLIEALAWACKGIGVPLDYVLWALFGLALILLVITIVKISLSTRKSAEVNTEVTEETDNSNVDKE